MEECQMLYFLVDMLLHLPSFCEFKRAYLVMLKNESLKCSKLEQLSKSKVQKG